MGSEKGENNQGKNLRNRNSSRGRLGHQKMNEKKQEEGRKG